MKKIFNIFSKLLYNLDYDFFMKNFILMESNPDFADNTKAVFDELIKRKYNDNFKIIWFVSDSKKFDDLKIKNVKFITRNKKIINLILFIYYSIFSRYIIDCNKSIKKRNHKQFRIYLTHGTPLKIASEYCKTVGEFDYVIQISDFFTKIDSELFGVTSDKIVSTGFPRNDIILDSKNGVDVFPDIIRDKTIFWFPTYRNHKLIKNDSVFNMNINFPYGVPLINNESELITLNDFLASSRMLLVIKLHPAEDSSKINAFNYSNIKLIEDSVFDEGHTNLYNMLSRADALITDYSSVYYDFLLTDKPIGLAIPDFQEYKSHVSLLFDNMEDNIPGDYLYKFDDLMNFFDNIKNGKDISYNNRLVKKKLYHMYFDSNSSKRVVDLFEKNVKGFKNEKRN